MTAAMEFGLLGPVLVRRGDAELPVAAGKQRAVLAALLLAAGRVVPADELAGVLWGGAPPASARVSVQNYVARLRQALGEAGRARIQTRPGGYRIQVEAGELDVARFEDLARAARAAARDGSWDEAAGLARSALAQWRGEPLADAGSERLLAREAPRLTELRRQVLATRLEADLQAGRLDEVIAELRVLTVDFPLRERLHGLLMLALARAGRPGDALAAYGRARRALVAELGAEPGAELQRLHQLVLAGGAGLAAGGAGHVADRAGPATEGAGRTAERAGRAGERAGQVGGPGLRVDDGNGPGVPQQLPGAVAHWAGRSAELAALTGLLDRAGESGPGTVVISAIAGTAGVGKTALAVRWGHQVADRFPDGQLYVNLRGYDPDQPVTAAGALAGFLSALGVAGPDIPAAEDERAARYRSRLAGRRVLVILDNAAGAGQVEPLLPGTPGCMVLVTSRDALAGLVARYGATRLDLGLLPIEDAVGLLRGLVGPRADADPAGAVTLAQRCARLPLALRVAAELAAARPAASLAELSGELADLQRRLDLLDAGGDPRTAVRSVFSWSYRHLDADAARAFRLLGLHPGPSLDGFAAAALTGTTSGTAAVLLSRLARAYLIQPAGPGRHGLHDLLRGYAGGQAERDDTGPDRHAAVTRLLDYYLHTAAAAIDTLYPAERDRRPRVPPAPGPVPPVAGPAAARAWLDAERAVLVTVAGFAAVRGWPGHAARLSPILFRYLDTAGHHADAVVIHDQARRAARLAGDRAAEAAALANLGVACWRQGRLDRAASCQREALILFGGAGDRYGEARALANLGIVDQQAGLLQQAVGHYRQALTRYQELGERFGQAQMLNNLGIIEDRQGRYRQAVEHHRLALALHGEIGDPTGQARALTNLGVAEERAGQYEQAAEHHQLALALFRETGNRNGEASALGNLGIIEERQNRPGPAADYHRQALTLFREIANRNGEAAALNGLGGALAAAGPDGPARVQFEAALDLASALGNQGEQARAHDGLAQAWLAAGDVVQARRHWQEALARYADQGVPDADAVRARLAALPDARAAAGREGL
jgi:DNA-binding SARP family transcriptional activator/tetratricopeptide (TPR) repeat protein